MSEPKKLMINNALRILRLYLGLSQKKLAKELDLSQSMISEIENGNKNVSIEILERYSSKLNIRMSQLMFFAEELDEELPAQRGRLIIANKVLRLLNKLAPREISNA